MTYFSELSHPGQEGKMGRERHFKFNFSQHLFLHRVDFILVEGVISYVGGI